MHIDEGANVQRCQSVRGKCPNMPFLGRGQMSGGEHVLHSTLEYMPSEVFGQVIVSPIGRLTVLKTLLISKLNHLIISLPNPKVDQISKLNKIFFEFRWKSSANKIKREVIIQDFEQGGLRMIHLEKIYLNLDDSKYKLLF